MPDTTVDETQAPDPVTETALKAVKADLQRSEVPPVPSVPIVETHPDIWDANGRNITFDEV